MQTPYEKDPYAWSFEQANFLKSGQYKKLDIENLAEEIESLGRRDKRALESQLVRLLHHMLKLEYTPENKGNSDSWEGSIFTARKHIRKLIKESPSLNNELLKLIPDSYKDALELAIMDSFHEVHRFPKECPWTIEEILGE